MPRFWDHRWCMTTVMLGIASTLWTPHLFAQANQATAGADQSPASDSKRLIDEAYQKTKSATSLQDFESLVQMCEQLQKSGLKPAQETYIKSLLSWSRNRRGELYTELASVAQEKGQQEEAEKLDTKALADFESAIQLDATRWKPRHNRGVSYAIAGKYQNAIDDFTKVVELNPNYSNAWFNRGEIYYDIGQFDKALKDYAEAIRLDPQDAGAYTSRAHTLFRLNSPKEALADYTKAYELAPDATALANRGDAYQSLGQWREAATDFEQAIKLDNNSPRALQCTAWLLATCPDELIRNQEYAIPAAQKAVDLIGQPDMRYLDTLAAAYADSGRFEEAIAKVTEAIALAQADEAAPLKKRLELYKQQRPYRQPGAAAATAQPKSTVPNRQAASGKRSS